MPLLLGPVHESYSMLPYHTMLSADEHSTPLRHCSADGGMGQFMLAARARADAATAAAAAAAAAKQKQGQAGGAAVAAAVAAGPGGNDYVARLARRRWDQVCMLVDFHKAHRWGSCPAFMLTLVATEWHGCAVSTVLLCWRLPALQCRHGWRGSHIATVSRFDLHRYTASPRCLICCPAGACC